MNELQQNESTSRLIIWWNFVPWLSKSFKGKGYLFLIKGGWFLLIWRLSINVTWKSLLLVARIEKSSKSGAWLQNKRWSLMTFRHSAMITFNLFPSECRNSQVFIHTDLKMTLSFAIIGSIAATTLKLANNART